MTLVRLNKINTPPVRSIRRPLSQGQIGADQDESEGAAALPARQTSQRRGIRGAASDTITTLRNGGFAAAPLSSHKC